MRSSMGLSTLEPAVQGVVADILPEALYAIRLTDGRLVRCALAGSSKFGVIVLREGDGVMVTISPRDPSRGRIVSLA